MKLHDAYKPIKTELLEVQQKISEQFQDSDEQVSSILQTLSTHQGKMLRSALTLLCGKHFAMIRPEHINLAAMIELVHVASLLHDDVIDKARLRRGEPSANALWGNTASVLLGDYLLSRAFILAAFSEYNDAVVLLGQAAQGLCIGELKQNLFKGQFDLTEQDYFQITEAKTAGLFSCSCLLGAIVSNAPKDQQEALGRFGNHFGLAFQIADDLRDILSTEKQEGKTLGTDFLQEKLTLPVIHWINQVESQKQSRADQVRTLKDPDSLTEQMRFSGSIDYAFEQANLRAKRAKQSLECLSSTPAKEALFLLADKVVADIS